MCPEYITVFMLAHDLLSHNSQGQIQYIQDLYKMPNCHYLVVTFYYHGTANSSLRPLCLFCNSLSVVLNTSINLY